MSYYGRNGHADFNQDFFGGGGVQPRGGGGQFMNFDTINALRAKTRSFNQTQQKRQNFGGISTNRSPLVSGGGTRNSAKTKNTEVGMRQISIDPAQCLTFYGQKHYMSTFYDAPMLIAGHMYPTVEHYYEACKVYAVAGPDSAGYMKNAQDPRQAKSISKEIMMSQQIPKRDVDQWKKSDGLLVMRVGMMEKFRQNPKLRSQLFRTGDSLLVQSNQYDTLWSNGMDKSGFETWLKEHKGESLDVPALIESSTVKDVPNVGRGKNLLGFILMYVRDCLKTEYGMVGKVAGGASTSGADVES